MKTYLNRSRNYLNTSEYVKTCFKNFCNRQKEIIIRYHSKSIYHDIFYDKECVNMLLFPKLIKIFKQCNKIESIDNQNISSHYLLSLYCKLQEINDYDDVKLNKIRSSRNWNTGLKPLITLITT